MFKISPVQNTDTSKKYLAECDAEFKDGAFVYSMTDIESGELMGLSQFEILGDEGIIFNICAAPGKADDEAMFILGRQTMNFIDKCGAHVCKAEKSASDADFMRKIGFKEQDGAYICDMHGMFEGHCSH